MRDLVVLLALATFIARQHSVDPEQTTLQLDLRLRKTRSLRSNSDAISIISTSDHASLTVANQG